MQGNRKGQKKELTVVECLKHIKVKIKDCLATGGRVANDLFIKAFFLSTKGFKKDPIEVTFLTKENST